MAHITSREELEEWLKDKPADWAQVILVRLAMRDWPNVFDKKMPDSWVQYHSISLFQALLISWAAINITNSDMRKAIRVASNALQDASRRNYYAPTTHAFLAIMRAFGSEKTYSISGIEYFANTSDWYNANSDCKILEESPSTFRSGSYLLTYRELWTALEPDSWRAAWQYATTRLLSLEPTYQVWIDWYNRRIEGHDAAFDIPGDIDRIEDKKILARLADATDEYFWGKGATYVNTMLQGWIDEARERVRQSEAPGDPPTPTPVAIRTIAAEIASPNVTLTNNQLDVITNTAFDGQTDTVNLDEAIAILRAVVAALLGGLPGNAPRSFAANLTIYDSELAKRDAKPFLGVLVRMEKSVSAGFHADPEMFDAGVATNFISYFDAHLDFMTHYRRNEEREAKIAQFKIDDAAASGTALTGPVDEVAKEVAALAEQGLVTEGYAQAVKEQQEINTQIALYSPSLPTASGEPTAKERHILQTVGFYERSLAVVNNVVSATAQFGAFVKVVKQAIAELLKFFV